jgi:hypothetical protein
MTAYGDFRDTATDYGYEHPADTPLLFLYRAVADREHMQLAWLATRAFWGDLQETTTDAHADAAEELSRALRKRLATAQPATMRVLAFLSPASMRRPYVTDLDAQPGPRAARRTNDRALADAAR